MKIEFVGTGSVRAPQLSACTLIDGNLLIDVGNGIVKKIKQMGYSMADIENCLITHLHGDHFADIPFLLIDRGGENTQNPLNIYGPQGLESKIKELYDILVFPIDFETAKEKAKVKFVEFKKLEHKSIDGKNFVTSFEVEHGNCKPAYGYIVERDNYKIGFSGDSAYCESVSQIVEQSDIAILDMCFIEAKKVHMGVEEVVKIAKSYPNKKFATTHMQEDARKEAKGKKIGNLIVPNDGEVIEV